MVAIESSLLYLRESMDLYKDHPTCQSILTKVTAGPYTSEEAFVTELSDQEISYLNALLRQELRYANQSEDRTRFNELNSIYELLY